MNHNLDYRKLKGWNDFGILKSVEISFYDNLFTHIRHHVKVIDKVLDFGFGNGQLLSYLQKIDLNFDAVEIDASSYFKASKLFPNVYLTEDFKPNSKYDLIFLLDVLEHNSHQDCVKIFKLCLSYLSDDGMIIIKVPNGDSPFALRNQNGDPTHINFFGIGKFLFYSSLLDFSVVKFYGDLDPIICKSFKHTLHRFFSVPIKYVLNKLFGFLFFPGNTTFFFSQSLIVFIKKNS